MKKLFSFKKESFIMILVLLFYGLIAGGSVDFLFDSNFWIIIGVMIALFIIIAIISSIISEKNKKARLELKKNLEEDSEDFDMTDKIGDDRCTLYFDKSKESVLIASITTDGINKYTVDNFNKSNAIYGSGSACAIDKNRRKALLVKDNASTVSNFKVIDYENNDFNKEFIKANNITPILNKYQLVCTPSVPANTVSPLFVLVEESYGYISVFNNMAIKESFNYISKDYIASKTSNSSSVTMKGIVSYVFILDSFFKVLTIISPLCNHVILNYKDIINVTYEEDGATLYSKSTGRTVGGTLVGGALLGGAGAIVGGLSGNVSQDKVVKSMKIKILVRNTTNPTITLDISLKGEKFKTKEKLSKATYDTRLRTANEIKDLLSVIIDEGSTQTYQVQAPNVLKPQQNEIPKSSLSVADELTKLVKLKEAGILTEEEFNSQKAKLLN